MSHSKQLFNRQIEEKLVLGATLYSKITAALKNPQKKKSSFRQKSKVILKSAKIYLGRILCYITSYIKGEKTKRNLNSDE